MTHPVTHSFSNGRATPSLKLFFKLSVDIRLNIRFQSVRTHGYIRVFKWFDHTRLHTRFQMIGTQPVKHSFSFSRDTPSYQLFIKLLIHTRLHTQFQMVGKRGFTVVVKWSCHTQFHTCFQMVGKHAVTHSFSNGWDTLGYLVVFKCPWHTRLHTRFQMVVPHPVSKSFSNDR